MTIHDQLLAFADTLALNGGQRLRVQQALNGLEGALGRDLGPTLGQVQRFVPQGSYERQTIIKPVDDHHTFDVDVILEGRWLDTDAFFASKLGPRETLRRLSVELRRHHNYSGKVKMKDRCVRVDFAGAFHLDLVPACPVFGRHDIPDKTNDTWVRTNPVEVNAWFRGVDKQHNGLTAVVCRLVREWKRSIYKKRGPSGLVLDVMVAQALYRARSVGSAEQALALAFHGISQSVESMANRLFASGPHLANPCMGNENLARTWNDGTFDGFRGHAAHATERARYASGEVHKSEALDVWSRLLGPRFAPRA